MFDLLSSIQVSNYSFCLPAGHSHVAENICDDYNIWVVALDSQLTFEYCSDKFSENTKSEENEDINNPILNICDKSQKHLSH